MSAPDYAHRYSERFFLHPAVSTEANSSAMLFISSLGVLFGKSGMSVSADEDAVHGDVDHCC